MSEILEGKKFRCAFCGGSGIQPRSLRSLCLACRGKGEVKFSGPVVKCHSCQGKGTAGGSQTLSCIRCGGIGVVKKDSENKETTDIIGERLGEITKKLRWTRKATEKKTKEIEKRLKSIKPFAKEIQKETQWIEKLGNKIKKGWQSFWEN